MAGKVPTHARLERNAGKSPEMEPSAPRWGLRQLPGLAVFASVVVGSCWDRFLPAAPWVYFAVVVCAAVAWSWRSGFEGESCVTSWDGKEEKWSTLWVLVAVAGAAAAWHHGHWHWYSANEISRFASPSPLAPRIVTVRGRWDSCVRREVSELDGQVRVLGSLKVVAIEDGGRWGEADGRLQVLIRRVSANDDRVVPGDLIQMTGELCRIAGPANPGEFDRRLFLRASRALARLDVASGGCVRRLDSAGAGTPGWFYRWSDRADQRLRRVLDERTYPVGAALLLGRREHLSAEQQDRFLRTGTVHMLAISGFHVGVLASGLLMATRTGWVPERTGMLLVMVAVWLFAEVTGQQAPVLRANLLVQISGLAWWLRRHAPPVNSLCWSAVLVWLRCPSDLFQAGPQLSFLAVAVLMHVQQPANVRERDPLERLVLGSMPPLFRWASLVLEQVGLALGVGLLVWGFTLPLVIEQFHVVALLAVPLNVLLWLPLVAALFSGFALLLVPDGCPVVEPVLATACRASLVAFETPIAWADQFSWMRCWHPGIGGVAVWLFYAVWSVYWAWPPWRHRWRRFVLLSLGVLVAGMGARAWASRLPAGSVRCSFLSVGHGACVVLQFSSGTWLYDCGRMAGGRSAVDAVSQSLWHLGVTRLERVVISHADTDHYSLLPGLLERFRVEEVVTGPGFWEDPSVTAHQLDQQVVRRGVVRTTCRRGDGWSVDEATQVEVLHPARSFLGESDNASSVVLVVHCGAQTLLLPGDLEGVGMAQLLSESCTGVTVAMAPHHGSCQEDPGEFLDWSRPRWLVVSGRGDGDSRRCLGQAWTRSRMETLHTGLQGAVTVELGPRGVRLNHFRKHAMADNGDDP